jgi:hypothetical protein
MNCVSPGQLFARKGSHSPLRFFLLLLLLLSSLDHHQVSASGDAASKDSNSVVAGVSKKLLLCPPLVCSCSDVDLSANCSHRGFLSTPPALPSTIRHLDLSFNDLETINSSEIIRLTQLESLDLRWENESDKRLHLIILSKLIWSNMLKVTISFNISFNVSLYWH